jgi:hypothetical protein
MNPDCVAVVPMQVHRDTDIEPVGTYALYLDTSAQKRTINVQDEFEQSRSKFHDVIAYNKKYFWSLFRSNSFIQQ